ncbi:cysteine desulfurase family protein [Ligilactobacillus cholophilus]|uniref:cysteine desulfurase family protein n=1 Tax=Ligilactobacillus cholophilus TaxID=3050131 RepID=UPI0025B07B7B|nr:cysteine desulfurase family protein [Ligilactobacillus cholophilus]
MDRIYLDNAATTPMLKDVVDTISDAMSNTFGNASAVNSYGREARAVLDMSRHTIAESINAKLDSEIIFTSGGTESDNTAIIQTANKRKNIGRHLITTSIEHEAVLKPMQYLESQGFEVTYLPVDENGLINLDDLKRELRDDTILVSIMTGNNEVGSKMPIHEIGEIVSESNAWFHTDAVQAYGLLDIDVQRDHIDLLSTSAHKLNGPKFLGFLYERDGLKLPSYIRGGDQELMRRAGTENIPGIAGFAKAVEIDNKEEKIKRTNRYYKFKEQIVAGLKANNIDFEINGKMNDGELPHVLNIWFKGVPNDVLITNLDLSGISVAAGSACTAGSLEPSHVLKAMYGENSERTKESIRFSFGVENTADEIDRTIDILVKIINRLKH